MMHIARRRDVRGTRLAFNGRASRKSQILLNGPFVRPDSQIVLEGFAFAFQPFGSGSVRAC